MRRLFVDPRSERGVTLVISLLLVVALLGVGMTALYYSSTHTRAAQNLTARQSALNAAKAGLEHARAVLAQVAAITPTAPFNQVLAGIQANPHHEIPTSAQPTRQGAILYSGGVPLFEYTYPNPIQPEVPRLGSYTVYVHNDSAELSAGMFTTDTNNSVIVRVLGRDPGNTATVVLEAGMSMATIGGSTGSLDNFIYSKNITAENNNATSANVTY